MTKMALEGITVADFGQTWAGPHAGKLLADMGARVIKIESMKRMDVIRSLPPWADEENRTLNNSGYYNWLNRNKFGVTLDLTTPRGSELAKEIIKISDVLIENFSRGVMDRFGLDYASVKEVNPKIIYVALTALGEDGPFRDFIMYGRPQIYMSGISFVTGYPHMQPHPTNISWGDPVGANHSVFAILSALHHRKKSGQGQYVELSQWECLIGISPENIMDYTLNKRVRNRQANRDEFMAPHNAYRCSGGDLKWVTIAVAGDEEWNALCRAMGNPEWTHDEKFTDTLSRWKNQEEMDRHIEAWTVGYTPYEVTEMLQKVGVAAFPCLSNRGLVEDPHLNDRDFFEEYDHPELGNTINDGLLWKMSKTPGKIRGGAPLVGEHNNYVFGELLGIPQDEIDRLAEEKVIY
ncbi:MAG: CoA transferase [Deltaproteobacteria bacterium]|nr:CoA transferase [Deltaproteobacteria bacterium]MBW2285191.1 CoA transferase [Deltaproteobacteria bacterium]